MKAMRTAIFMVVITAMTGLWATAKADDVDWRKYQVDFWKNGKKAKGADLDAIKTTEGLIIKNGTGNDSLRIAPAKGNPTVPPIPLVRTDASINKLFTKVTIGSVEATSGVIATINADKSYIGTVKTLAVGDVAMAARMNSTAATSPTFAVTSLTGGAAALGDQKNEDKGKDKSHSKLNHPSKLMLKGVILENFDFPARDVLWMNIQTKKEKGAVSLAGIGPLERVRRYLDKSEPTTQTQTTTPTLSVVNAKSIKNMFVFGAPVVPDKLTGEVRNVFTQGKVVPAAGGNIAIAGDIAPVEFVTAGLNVRLEALGGDIKPQLLFSKGNIWRLWARFRIFDNGSGGVSSVGGHLGFISDVADAGTTPTAPTSYTMHVIVQSGNIQRLLATFGVYGLFIAGWNGNATTGTATYSGAISRITVALLRGSTPGAASKLGIWGGACIADVWRDDLIKNLKGDPGCVKGTPPRFMIYTEKNPM
ncbi:MAG: hypothetical protein NTX50_02800 [Candidatus Sumerlaeota bacterium]|nr:hypothetical protein [Candidatus Sumerlaeota bacterium]